MNTSKNLKKVFLNRLGDMDINKWNNQSMERHIRHMRNRYWKEFDQVWVNYNNNKATYQQWEKALDMWLNSELI